jgi:hypothetical protein
MLESSAMDGRFDNSQVLDLASLYYEASKPSLRSPYDWILASMPV